MALNWAGGATGLLGGGASGAAIGSVVPGIGTAIGTGGGALLGLVSGLFSGGKEKHRQKSRLLPEQEKLYQQLQNALNGKGGGGAFGEAADYYRDLIDPNSQTAEAMFAPENRRFNEETIPGLAEQFAGMGSGGLSSSGFRNSTVNAGTDLAERLGAIRANLKLQGAQGLANLGGIGLGNFSQDVITQPGYESPFSTLAPAFGEAGTQLLFDKIKENSKASVNTAAGKNSLGGDKIGKNSSPYGAPQGGFQLPNRTF
jgi:hypothetical protein